MKPEKDMTLFQWIHRRDFYLHESQRRGIPRWLRQDYRAMAEIEELNQEHSKKPYERTEK